MALAQNSRGSTGGRFYPAALLDVRVIGPIFVILLLSFYVVIPLILTVVASFRPPGVLPTEAGPFTVSPYINAFTGADFRPIIINTLLYALGGVLFGLPIAFLFAFLSERTDMPFRNWMYLLMFIPMSTPVFATALGWVLLLGPRAGTINQWIRIVTGSDATDGPFNIFTIEGLIFVHVLGGIPTMWLFLISVLRSMDPALEEASSTVGGTPWNTMKRITIPLMFPGVAAVLVYFFITGLESLELPLALGPTAGINTLATKIFFTILPSANVETDYGVPAAFGMLALVIGLFGIASYLYLVRRAARYAVVTGKGYRPKLIRLGRWKYVALGLVGLYVLIKIVLPFSILLTASFLKFYVPLVPETAGHLRWTFDNYDRVLDYRFFGRFFINTIIVAVSSAFSNMLFVTFIAWLIVRYPSRLTRAVNVLAFLPLAIPGTISTIALFLMFIGTPLYGTLALMVLAFAARYTAFGTRLMHSAQLQIHRELEEASYVSGAGAIRTFFTINVRLLIPAFLNGWLWIMVHAAKDFSVALLLASGASALIGNVIYGSFTAGDFPRASAQMVVLIAFNLVLVLIGRRWIRRAVGGEQTR